MPGTPGFGIMSRAPGAGVMRAGGLEYYQAIKILFGPALTAYWPLWESSGAVAEDISGNGRNGAYVNGAVGAAGIGDGRSGFALDGTGDGVNVYSAGLAAGFPYQEGGISFFAKSPAGMWTDGASRYWCIFQCDTNNRIMIRREAVNNQISFFYIAGGTVKSWTFTDPSNTRGYSKADWINYTFTWSRAAGTAKVYINGALFHTLTAVGIWAGVLGVTVSNLGASSSAGATSLNGTMAHAMIVNREISAAEARSIYNQSPLTCKTLSILGDSISNETADWPHAVTPTYNGGNCVIVGHAAAGHNIIANMDAQAVEAATDNADIVIVALGTNDADLGDMAALQAEYEENIIELKASNPKARIYGMNVLPRWTAADGLVEVDKSHIRAAISAACTAQGVTCWDTYSVPWIVAADTSDGIHPAAGGVAKIAAEVLARLA